MTCKTHKPDWTKVYADASEFVEGTPKTVLQAVEMALEAMNALRIKGLVYYCDDCNCETFGHVFHNCPDVSPGDVAAALDRLN